MNKMNTKMKVLSLALLGLGGFALAGTAAAACPTAPDAWSSTSTLGGSLVISSPGFDGSECKLDASFPANMPGATAFVRDNSPTNESRYRAQFLVNADAIATMSGLESVKIFTAITDTASGGVNEIVQFTVFGDAIDPNVKLLGYVAACSTAPSKLCSGSIPLVAASNRVEFDWDSSSNDLKVWLNNTNEGSPTKSLSLGDMSAWGGVDYVTLGLANGSPAFMVNQAGNVVSFDQFDSRRQTFIGH